MKKLILSVLIPAFVSSLSIAQNFVSITPNSGVRGTTVSTTVTSVGFFFTQGSAPSIWGDFYMQKGTSFIYPSVVNILGDNLLTANWTIPSTHPTGNYSVIYNDFQNTYSIPGGFNSGDVFVSGKVYHDIDSSTTFNGAEYGMTNQKVILLPDSAVSFTNSGGDYVIGTTGGIKNVKALPDPIWNITNTSPIQVNVGSANVTGIDFGLKGVADIYDIEGSITGAGVPRCFSNVTYTITYINTGTVTTHGEVNFIRATNCVWVSSSIPPDLVNANVYTWNYTNLLPGESRTIIVVLSLPGAGSSIQNSISVIARDNFNNIVSNDEDIITQTVLCAMDPNDKTVIPEGVFAQHYTLMSDTLDFIIRFQNTGNDTAFKVVILDTLNKNILDLSSFRLIAYSHPVVVDLRTNGRTTFTFDNILLPDSNINEPESHGFVRYRCLIKPGLANNTILNNRAHIYFDFNAAVITNTTLNTLVYTIPVGLNDPDALAVATVIPNPTSDKAVIAFPNPNKEEFRINIFDTQGRVVYSKLIHGNYFAIDKAELGTGMFLYQLASTGNKKQMTGKFVIH